MPEAEGHPLQGVILMLFALFFFALLDAAAKHLAQTFALPLLVWARYTFHCLLMVVFLAPSLRLRLVVTRKPVIQVVRALLLVAVSLLSLAAFRTMPLAETTAILLVTPLMVALLAARFLGEKVGLKRWLTIVVGFAGAMLIARPGGALTLNGILLSLGAALCYALYQVLTRQLSATENTFTMLFYTALTGTVVMSLSLPWFWSGPLPSGGEALLIASLGICGGTGHFLVTRAFRHAPASTLSPLTYAQLLWATLLGWQVFGQLPDAWSILGMMIIAASGLSIALAERATARGQARH